MTPEAPAAKAPLFSRYQVFLIVVLAFIQFTVILDFMVMAPLGAILMPVLKITPGQFSHVVSGYAFAAGISGLLAAGFADKYDRKKLLLFFYTGFIAATLFCGLAPTYELLLAARILTGVFGGVIGSVGMAIVTDSFPLEKRGRVMGFIQMAFAASQVLGIPVGLYLAHFWDWHAPFLLIVGVGVVAGLVMWRYMRPVAEHLHLHHDTDPVKHLVSVAGNPRHWVPFLGVVLLATGGFMMMPFSTAFQVNNLLIPEAKLPLVFMIVGAFSFITFPLVGKLSDNVGKLPTFIFGSVLAIAITIYYSHLGPTPLWLVIMLSTIMFAGISSRMVSSSALMSAVPELRDRGAFMSITSSVQQISGGIAAWMAGLIVVQPDAGPLLHYDTLAYVCSATMVICVVLIWLVDRQVKRHQSTAQAMRQAA
ncbi:MAG: MFS transporter [Bacteroidetes bacterium]|nr:MFS transporter [Bacteroidota bacterium]